MCFWNRGKSYYLLIVFGSGVLFLFIQCSQPCLSACVWAGAAQWLVCSTLSNGIKSRGNTALSQSARQLYLQCFFPLTCYSSVIQKKKSPNLTLTLCHAEKQGIRHVSLTSSMETSHCENILSRLDRVLFIWYHQTKAWLRNIFHFETAENKNKTSSWIITTCGSCFYYIPAGLL